MEFRVLGGILRYERKKKNIIKLREYNKKDLVIVPWHVSYINYKQGLNKQHKYFLFLFKKIYMHILYFYLAQSQAQFLSKSTQIEHNDDKRNGTISKELIDFNEIYIGACRTKSREGKVNKCVVNPLSMLCFQL